MKKILLLVILLLISCAKEKEDYIMSEDGTIKYVEIETITKGEEEFSLFVATDPNLEDEVELTFIDSRTTYLYNEYRLQMLEPIKKYRIYYNDQLYDGFELIDQELLTIDDYLDLKFPFAVYFNDSEEVGYLPDEMPYEAIRTVNVNEKEFQLLKAKPSGEEVVACYKLESASTKYFDGIYDANCFNEYKVRFNEVDYYGWELYNLGEITVNQLESLGYPVEKD